jgi:hypothetical protein
MQVTPERGLIREALADLCDPITFLELVGIPAAIGGMLLLALAALGG